MTLPDELEAKQEILQVLGHLGDSAQRRVTSWVHQRILGDLLTSLVGGVLTSVVGGAVNEPIRFDLKVLTYRLAEPASALRSIEGTSSGLPRTFLVAIDFVFSGTASNTVVWLDEGTKPDGDTTFFVDYLGVESRSPLSDLKVGSVTRALAEAVARELATLYEQLNLTYQSARGRHLLPRPRAGLQHHHPRWDPAGDDGRFGRVRLDATPDPAERTGAHRRAGARRRRVRREGWPRRRRDDHGDIASRRGHWPGRQPRTHDDPEGRQRVRRRATPTRQGRTDAISKTADMRTCPVINFTPEE